jgi:GAF domain-containing protein
MVNHQRLAGVLTDFARNLVTDYRIDDMLDMLCREVVEIMPVTGAGVMLTDEPGDLRFVSASNDLIQEIESLQIELGEGPCLHAYETGEQVVEDDLASGSLFPTFGARAVKAGIRGVYSFPMRVENVDQHVGALNFYTAGPGDFDEDDRAAGQTLADVATTYIVNARAFERSMQLTGQLQHALDTRVVVEQAKGMLAAHHDVTIPEAFERLRAHARRNRLKLHDVARDLIEGRLRLGRS